MSFTHSDRLTALVRYKSGERLCFSTGIDDSPTYGYGELDVNGFWQYPLSYDDLRPEHKELVDNWINGFKK